MLTNMLSHIFKEHMTTNPNFYTFKEFFTEHTG